MKGLGERLPPKVLDHCLHLAQDLLPLLFLGTLFRVMLNINGIQIPVVHIYMYNDFEANSTSLMSLWANIKFFPEPTGELYGWLLATLVNIVQFYKYWALLLGISIGHIGQV